MSWFSKRVLIVVSMVAAAACGGSSNSTPTAPTGSANTETFTGSIDVGSAGPVHNFTIQQSNGHLISRDRAIIAASRKSSVTCPRRTGRRSKPIWRSRRPGANSS